MTTPDSSEATQKLRRELLLEQAIDTHRDELVRLATIAVLTLPKMRDQKLEESQLRNLAAVASSSSSVEVIANFIRYQIARAPKNWGIGPNEFGHTIIGHLYQQIAAIATTVADTVKQELHSDDPGIRSEAYTTLMRQYIGYLNRSFYFYNKSVDNKNPDVLKQAITHLEQVRDAK